MSALPPLDYIIVGQGLAGTLLAHHLLARNQKIVVIDQGHKGSATKAASGIINPVTGRRMVKSWMIETLLPYAEKCYSELEQLLDIELFTKTKIYRTLKKVAEENLWSQKALEYTDYLNKEIEYSDLNHLLVQKQRIGQIRYSIRIHLQDLIEKYRWWLDSNQMLYPHVFEFRALEIEDELVHYQTFTARHIVFCDGAGVLKNPYFMNLPFSGCKGESLIVSIPEWTLSDILKANTFIIPLKNDLYWVGSNFEWNYSDKNPTPEFRLETSDKVKSLIRPEFKVKDHLAGVRPVVKHRRPLMGTHPNHNMIHLFNGMGTKGASLAPFWSNEMVSYLTEKKPLSPEVDLQLYIE